MTVLDAYAVIAYLRDEAAAAKVRRLLGADAVLTAVGLAEVIDRLARGGGIDEEAVVLDLAQLGLMDAIPIDAELGLAAGRLRAVHYHRTRCAVSMSDCIAVAAADARHDRLATSDPHLLDVCRAESLPVIALPGSDGSTWRPLA